jgi:hypothetical protein
VFHLELHKFPNNMARFNLSSEEMFAVAVPWAKGEWIEFGERKWNPHEARLTVLEGPPIPVNQLRVGRGWRLAQRQAEDVTERVLAAAANAPEAKPPTPQSPIASGTQTAEEALIGAAGTEGSGGDARRRDATPTREESSADFGLLADSLGLQLLAVLDGETTGLSTAWELAQERLPGRSAGESLALAERAVRALLDSGLIVLYSVHAGQGAGNGGGDQGDDMGEEEVEVALRTPASWSGRGERAEIRMRRH